MDLVWNLPLESIDQFKKNPKIAIDSVPTSTWDGIIMNGAQKPLDDSRVRHAISLAIDKKAMVELALFGNGTPTHTMIPPGIRSTTTTSKRRAKHRRGKKLLAEAGYPNGFDITIYMPVGRPTRERIGLAVREMLKPINIKVDIQRVPWDKFINEVEGKRLSTSTASTAGRRSTRRSIPGITQRLVEHHAVELQERRDGQDARRCPCGKTEAEQKANYLKFQVLALEEPPGVIPYVINHMNAYRKNVKGFQSSPMMWLDLRKVTVQ